MALWGRQHYPRYLFKRLASPGRRTNQQSNPFVRKLQYTEHPLFQNMSCPRRDKLISLLSAAELAQKSSTVQNMEDKRIRA